MMSVSESLDLLVDLLTELVDWLFDLFAGF